MFSTKIKIFSIPFFAILLICLIAGCSSNASTASQTTKPLTNSVKIDGLFGAKWLMNKNEVLQNVGECKQASADSYMQIREYLGRKATVNFNFNNGGKMWMIIITFMESYDSGKANMTETIRRFDATQTEIEKQYGTFTSKKINDNQTRDFSFVAADNIKVSHSIEKKDPYIIEQILFSIWNGK